MGFKSSADVVKALSDLAHINTDTGKSLTGRQVFVVVDEKLERADSLPEGTVADIVCVDFTSLLAGPGCSARTGADVLARLQASVDEYATVFKARKVVFCFDMRGKASPAKSAERADRAEKRARYDVTPYVDTLELRHADAENTSPPLRVTMADFSYELDGGLPLDYTRVMATPSLLGKFSRFITELLIGAVKLPPIDGFTLIVSGHEKHDASGKLTDEHETVYLTQEAMADGSFNKLRHTEAACSVGEGEGQCVHWWLKELKATSSPLHALLVANDTDLIALGLLNFPRLFDPTLDKIVGSLFVDYSYTARNKRLVDIVGLWRNLKRSLNGDQPVRHNVQLTLLAFMLSGNDYCQRIPYMGARTLAKFVRDALLDKMKTRKPNFMIVVDEERGEIAIDERPLIAFLAAVCCAQKYAEDALGYAEGQPADVAENCGNIARAQGLVAAWRPAKGRVLTRDWIIEAEDQRLLFDTLHAATVSFNAHLVRSAGKRKGCTIVPSYEQVCAHVRRAFYSLHYYTHIHTPELMLDPLIRTKDGKSMFGYAHGEFLQEVARTNADTGQRAQPFLSAYRTAVRERVNIKRSHD